MNRIKQLRLEFDESQEFLGTLIGVSGQAIGQYELGKRDLSPDKILKLAKHFNCSTDYLLGYSDVRNPQKIDTDKINIGLSTKDYNPPTQDQKEKIEEFARFILKDNLKDKKKRKKNDYK